MIFVFGFFETSSAERAPAVLDRVGGVTFGPRGRSSFSGDGKSPSGRCGRLKNYERFSNKIVSVQLLSCNCHRRLNNAMNFYTKRQRHRKCIVIKSICISDPINSSVRLAFSTVVPRILQPCTKSTRVKFLIDCPDFLQLLRFTNILFFFFQFKILMLKLILI